MLTIRPAVPADASTIHQLIVELAIYEREPDAVEVTVAELTAQLSEPQPPFSCLIAEVEGLPVGLALYFYNYSTWRGRRGLYLEDLFVSPAHRGQGYGRALLARLAATARAQGCARMEWAVLRWNRLAIDFYEKLGAEELEEWAIYRLTDAPLARLAEEDVHSR